VRYVLDTNVVSALRVRGRNPAVERWASAIPVADQYVAALTIAELERGIVAKERDDAAQGSVLRRWFEDNVLPAFAERVVPFDLAAARILATYRVPEHAPYDDAVIAATAQACGAVIATRNTRHFAPLTIETVNPWEPATWR
jgi:toxin FitB